MSNCPYFDRVFTSEDYEDVFAEAMGAVHYRFDKARTIVPISATLIRQKPLTYWDYINNFAKDYFVKKIAIVGTESTGKTVLTEKLAKHYNTVWVSEAGRELIPDSKKCRMEDLVMVASEHAKQIQRLTRQSNKILFLDTDVRITKSYMQFLFGATVEFEPWIEKANDVDMYIYLDKQGVPYVDDGTRLPLTERNLLDEYHQNNIFKYRNEYVKTFSFNSTINSKEAYEERFNNVIKEVDKFINEF